MKNKFLSLIIFSFATNCFSDIEHSAFEGEWALNPPGQSVTSILHFYDDGMVDNVVSLVTGKHQFLRDKKILIEFEDGVMIGQLEESESGYTLNGIHFSPTQRIQLEFTKPTEEKREQAQEFQDNFAKNVMEMRQANIDQAIRNNLAAIAAAGQMYMLLEGKTEVSLSELVGEGKLIPRLNPIYGESYEGLQINHETNHLSVRDRDGKEHAHEF